MSSSHGMDGSRRLLFFWVMIKIVKDARGVPIQIRKGLYMELTLSLLPIFLTNRSL